VAWLGTSKSILPPEHHRVGQVNDGVHGPLAQPWILCQTMTDQNGLSISAVLEVFAVFASGGEGHGIC
jgi:hypothetical protein